MDLDAPVTRREIAAMDGSSRQTPDAWSPDLLPHAQPFLFVDRVLDIGERSGRVLRAITRNDAILRGYPVLPPTLVVEAMAQAAGIFVRSAGGGSQGLLVGLDGFTFGRPVTSGDLLVLEVTLQRVRDPYYVVEGRALVGDEVRARGRLTLSRTPDATS